MESTTHGVHILASPPAQQAPGWQDWVSAVQCGQGLRDEVLILFPLLAAL